MPLTQRATWGNYMISQATMKCNQVKNGKRVSSNFIMVRERSSRGNRHNKATYFPLMKSLTTPWVGNETKHETHPLHLQKEGNTVSSSSAPMKTDDRLPRPAKLNATPSCGLWRFLTTLPFIIYNWTKNMCRISAMSSSKVNQRNKTGSLLPFQLLCMTIMSILKKRKKNGQLS